MNVRNWSFSCDTGVQRSWKQNIVETISLWTAIGLLWYAFVSIIEEHFPQFLQDVTPEYVTITMDWWVIALVTLFLWLGYDWPKYYLRKLVAPCRVAGLVAPIVYIVANIAKIMDGIISLAWVYLPHFNYYYKNNLYAGVPVVQANGVIAFTALFLLLWSLVWLLAYGWKKRVLLAVFPFLAVVAEIFVGLSPHGNGLYVLFLAVSLLLMIGEKGIIKKGIVLALVGGSILLSGLLFEKEIKAMSREAAKQAVLSLQQELKLDNLAKLLRIDFHFDWENLSNEAPVFTGEVLMEIEADGIPGDSLYLRGFYATDYKNSKWVYDDSYMKQLCQKEGVSQEEAAKQVFQQPYYRLRQSNGMITYTITMTGATGDVAYVPYYSNHHSLDEAYTWMGDYLLKKSVWDEVIEVAAIKDEVTFAELKDAADLVDLDWYNDLAEAYLSVPEDMDYIKTALTEAVETYGDASYSSFDLQSCVELWGRETTYSWIIQEYLEKNMSYSLELDALSMGTDPIEYALTVSHEGYCMHFASIATLMFREAGIPARYVSGYMVSPGEFSYSVEDGSFWVNVTDYDAHAWVEIYWENLGWIPVEVTPGYSADENMRPTEKQPETPKVEPETQQREETEKTQESEDTSASTEESEATEENQATDTSENSEESSQDNSQQAGVPGNQGQSTRGPKVVFQGLAMVFGLAAVVAAALFGIHKWCQHLAHILEQEVAKGQTRRAVKRIHRRLYLCVRFGHRGGWTKGHWSDKALEQALVQQLTCVDAADWSRYMEIAQKNHYSHQEITVEEMQFCYDCYKKCIRKGGK